MIDGKLALGALIGAAAAAIGASALDAADVPVPRAYVIAEINVTDPVAYQRYATQTPPIPTKYGGAYLVRGGKTVAVEGALPTGRVVVMEFPSLAAVEAYENSPEYQAINRIRQRASTGRLFIVEGVGAK